MQLLLPVMRLLIPKYPVTNTRALRLLIPGHCDYQYQGIAVTNTKLCSYYQQYMRLSVPRHKRLRVCVRTERTLEQFNITTTTLRILFFLASVPCGGRACVSPYCAALPFRNVSAVGDLFRFTFKEMLEDAVTSAASSTLGGGWKGVGRGWKGGGQRVEGGGQRVEGGGQRVEGGGEGVEGMGRGQGGVPCLPRRPA